MGVFNMVSVVGVCLVVRIGFVGFDKLLFFIGYFTERILFVACLAIIVCECQ